MKRANSTSEPQEPFHQLDVPVLHVKSGVKGSQKNHVLGTLNRQHHPQDQAAENADHHRHNSAEIVVDKLVHGAARALGGDVVALGGYHLGGGVPALGWHRLVSVASNDHVFKQ